MSYRHIEGRRIFARLRTIEKSSLPEGLKVDSIKGLVSYTKGTDWYKHSIGGRIAISKAKTTKEFRAAMLKAVQETEAKFKKYLGV